MTGFYQGGDMEEQFEFALHYKYNCPWKELRQQIEYFE